MASLRFFAAFIVFSALFCCLSPVTAWSDTNVMHREEFPNLLRKSLSRARQFLVFVDREIAVASRDSRNTVAPVQALKDCRDLAWLSVKHLATVYVHVGRNDSRSPVGDERVREVHTLLSTVLTNQQTCVDDLVSSWTRVSERAAKDTELYGVALSFFAKAWVRGTDKEDRAMSMSLPRWNRLGLFQDNKMEMFDAYKSVVGKRHIDLDDRGSRHQMITVGEVVVVSKDGSGNFTSIGRAIAAAPENRQPSEGYYMIHVKAGVYHENLNLGPRKSYIAIVGNGINKTVITGNRSAADGWGTFDTATFILYGPYFVGMHLTIRNTAGPSKGQAVALTSASDQSTFYKCSFEGYQDTLYTHSNAQVFRECDIYGTVDFIFGNAGLLLDRCNIYPRLPLRGQSNEITAQGRWQPDQNTGTFLHNCTVRASPELYSVDYPVRTKLGRPWKEYSRTIVMNTYLDASIHPSGWDTWVGDFALNTLYYAEYGNKGPGSDTTNRVKWPGIHIWSRREAEQFLAESFPVYSGEV